MIHIDVTDEELQQDVADLEETILKVCHKYNGRCEVSRKYHMQEMYLRIDTRRVPK